MNVLYLLEARGDGLEGVCALRREQIRRATDRVARLPITAYAVSAESLPPAVQSLFSECVVMPLPAWGEAPAIPLRRLRRIGRARQEAAAADAIAGLIRRWHIDLVHSATVRFQIGAIAAQMARRPHLWHVRDWIGAIGRLRFPLEDRGLVDAIADRSAAVIVPGAFAGAIFRAYSAPHLHIIPEGIDPAPFERVARPDLALPPVIGLRSGLMAPWQGHDQFIEMAAIVRHLRPYTRFVIDATADDDLAYARHIVRLARQRVPPTGDHPGITFVRADPSAALTALVHPCATETVARPTLAAQAARIPVVGPNSGALGEVVRDDVTGLLTVPDDPAALARAVITLIDDPALRARLGERGRAYILEQHHISTHTDAVEHLYAAALRQ